MEEKLCNSREQSLIRKKKKRNRDNVTRPTGKLIKEQGDKPESLGTPENTVDEADDCFVLQALFCAFFFSHVVY